MIFEVVFKIICKIQGVVQKDPHQSSGFLARLHILFIHFLLVYTALNYGVLSGLWLNEL